VYFKTLSVRQTIGAVPCFKPDVVTCLREVPAHFCLVHLGFVGYAVAVGQVFLRVLRLFILPVLSVQFIFVIVYTHTEIGKFLYFI